MLRNHLSPTQFPTNWASEWGEDCYGLWLALSIRGVRQIFRWCPPGRSMMGSPKDEKGRYDWEKCHEVNLTRGFWMAETTVTQAFWKAIMANSPSQFEGDNHPVERVSWDDTQVFIKKLNQFHPDFQFSLPTEAQWEYACRAGTQTAFNFAGELTVDKVNYRGVWGFGSGDWEKGAKKQTVAVKSYPCNELGLYEMHGNVWEWCQDGWEGDLSADFVEDPINKDNSVMRVVRGGSWDRLGGLVRSAFRYGYKPDYRNNFIGLRLSLGH